VLNDLLGEVDSQVVVFTDANTLFARDALMVLAHNFSDPQVGAVSGELKLQPPSMGDNQDDRYWRLETALKMGESRIGGLLGANGAIYAIRRSLYVAVPTDTIVDDFTIVMNISAMGWRTVFDPRAVAYEDTPSTIDAEFRRRIRIGIGNYQAFFRYPQYWRRATNVRRFTYVSHKVLRWFTPHLLIVALLANAMLLAQPLYAALFAMQLMTYAVLAIAMLLRKHISLPRLINLPLFLFALNVAFLIGFWRFANGSATGLWQRTERT
jgi:cellulose synthase/poly-beta-1,6-N-acetylglucosamine synthase-like glycosyltransferase